MSVSVRPSRSYSRSRRNRRVGSASALEHAVQLVLAGHRRRLGDLRVTRQRIGRRRELSHLTCGRGVADRRDGRRHTGDSRPVRRLPARRQHRDGRRRPLDDRRHRLEPRCDPLHQRGRPSPGSVAGDVGLPGDAGLLLRRRVLQPRRVRIGAPAWRIRVRFRPRSGSPAARAIARPRGRVGRRTGRAAPHRHRRPHRTQVRRPRPAARRAPARTDDSVRALVVPRRLPRRRVHRSGHRRAPPALSMVDTRRLRARRVRRRRRRLHRRGVRVPLSQCGVRLPPTAPARPLLRGWDGRVPAPSGAGDDGRRRARRPRVADQPVAVPPRGRRPLRLVPRYRVTTRAACSAPMSSGCPTPTRRRSVSCSSGSG